MTHLIDLETLQFAFYFKYYYTGVLYNKLNCLILQLKPGVHVSQINFHAAHWLHNLAKFPKSD